VPHRNAPLTETGQLRLACCIVDRGWPISTAAARFQVARTTAKKWSDRYRGLGPAGMVDRSSRPTAHRGARRSRSCARSCICAGGTGSARWRLPPGSGWRPRRCTGSWWPAE
jgi:hypothetical protein